MEILGFQEVQIFFLSLLSLFQITFKDRDSTMSGVGLIDVGLSKPCQVKHLTVFCWIPLRWPTPLPNLEHVFY